MDYHDFQLSSESYTGKNDIFLDDIPVDSLLYKNKAMCRPTPADIAMQWAEGYPLSEPAKKALVAILVYKNSIVFKLNRAKALDLLEKQQYAEAEKIYRQMIELDFELPGTLCHLARVQLLSGQEREAEKSIRQAWDRRSKALKYVVPRVIFFKILFLMIRNQDYSLWISRMGKELQNPDSFLEWHIHPLLESFKSRLSPENHEVLVTLAESLQNKDPKSLRGFLFS